MVPENDIDYGSREIPAWIEDATDAILLHLMNFPPDAETTANRLIQPYLHYIDANGEYRERPMIFLPANAMSWIRSIERQEIMACT